LKIKSKLGALVKIGNIDSIVEERVIIKPVDKIILDIDNFLMTKDRLIVGVLDDVFGAIEKPWYSVLNDAYIKAKFKANEIQIGDPVFAAGPEMKILYQDRIDFLKSRKGCDASNKFDEEIYDQMNTEEMAFSDDEEEESYQSRVKHGQLGKREGKHGHDDRGSKRKEREYNPWESKPQHDGPKAETKPAPVPMSAPQAYPSMYMPYGGLNTGMGQNPAFPAQFYGHPQIAGYVQNPLPPMTAEQYANHLNHINMMYGYSQNTPQQYFPENEPPQ
jgi:rRNA processing protein Gar1